MYQVSILTNFIQWTDDNVVFLWNYNNCGSEAEEVDVATTLPTNVKEILKNANATEVKLILNNTRRIIDGLEASANRPYMVRVVWPAINYDNIASDLQSESLSERFW